jgi:hypothetical protein
VGVLTKWVALWRKFVYADGIGTLGVFKGLYSSV